MDVYEFVNMDKTLSAIIYLFSPCILKDSSITTGVRLGHMKNALVGVLLL